MTEERIKELAGKVWAEHFEPYEGLQMSKYELTQFMRTVAAEARKEGLKEGRDIAIAAFETDIDSMLWDLNRIRVFIREAIAERLKEKGK